MSEQDEIALVMTTVETSDDGEKLARLLVDQSLAACVQIDGPIISHYRWAGKIQRAEEFRLMIKTSRAAWPAVKQDLAKHHPYDEPEIIMLTIDEASDGYRDWVIDQTT